MSDDQNLPQDADTTDYAVIRGILEKYGKLIAVGGYKRGERSVEPTYETHEDGTMVIEIYDGYTGFYTDIAFDKDGNLESISAWE